MLKREEEMGEMDRTYIHEWCPGLRTRINPVCSVQFSRSHHIFGASGRGTGVLGLILHCKWLMDWGSDQSLILDSCWLRAPALGAGLLMGYGMARMEDKQLKDMITNRDFQARAAVYLVASWNPRSEEDGYILSFYIVA
jgi:hypothetical protein